MQFVFLDHQFLKFVLIDVKHENKQQKPRKKRQNLRNNVIFDKVYFAFFIVIERRVKNLFYFV